MAHPLGSPFVRDHLALRTLPANDRPLRAERPFVLYWMQSTQRLEDNWALRLATIEADRVNKPLLVLHLIDSGQLHASARFHTFTLEGALELSARAAERGVTYRVALCRQRHDWLRLLQRVAANAALVITDQFPTEGVPARTAELARRLDCRVLMVDSAGVVPAACLPREEYSARTIRPKLARLFTDAAEAVTDRPPKRAFPEALLGTLPLDAIDPRPGTLASLVASCDVDHRVAPVATRGGLTAARARLHAFVADGLRDYRRRRSNPSDLAGTSRLSPYLHYGMISPSEVFGVVREAGLAAEGEAFLEEVLIWRELALNFCIRNPAFASLSSSPSWAQRSMAARTNDARSVTYTLAQLEHAETDDLLWNAGQRELVETGTMHPLVRMLWGKAVIAWAPTYDDAFTWLVHLNDRYALDARDPGSYAGIHWCFGKFDRPFASRPVWGAIRPMSLARAWLKHDVEEYVTRWQQAPAAQVA